MCRPDKSVDGWEKESPATWADGGEFAGIGWAKAVLAVLFAGQGESEGASKNQWQLAVCKYHYTQKDYRTELYNFRNTVGTKIIADPEKCFQELISEKLLILLRDRPCLELIIVSINFKALLFLQDKLLESV